MTCCSPWIVEVDDRGASSETSQKVVPFRAGFRVGQAQHAKIRKLFFISWFGKSCGLNAAPLCSCRQKSSALFGSLLTSPMHVVHIQSFSEKSHCKCRANVLCASCICTFQPAHFCHISSLKRKRTAARVVGEILVSIPHHMDDSTNANNFFTKRLLLPVSRPSPQNICLNHRLLSLLIMIIHDPSLMRSSACFAMIVQGGAN